MTFRTIVAQESFPATQPDPEDAAVPSPLSESQAAEDKRSPSQQSEGMQKSA